MLELSHALQIRENNAEGRKELQRDIDCVCVCLKFCVSYLLYFSLLLLRISASLYLPQHVGISIMLHIVSIIYKHLLCNIIY